MPTNPDRYFELIAAVEKAATAPLLERIAALEAKLAQRVPDGWKLVPVKPTEAMVVQGAGIIDDNGGNARWSDMREAWDTMLSAAPAAPEQQEPNITHTTSSHLEEIYAYLCSTSPKGYADEAFRNVPDSLLPDSVRNRLAEQGASMGDLSGAIPEHVGSPEGADGRDGQSVAAKVAQPVQPSEQAATLAIDALEAAKNGLDWYRGVCPQHVAGDDDEMDQQIETAIAVLQVAQAKPEQAAQPLTDPLHDDIQSVLFEVEQAIENGSCPWQIEAAFEAYEAARRLQLPAHGIAAPQPKD